MRSGRPYDPSGVRPRPSSRQTAARQLSGEGETVSPASSWASPPQRQNLPAKKKTTIRVTSRKTTGSNTKHGVTFAPHTAAPPVRDRQASASEPQERWGSDSGIRDRRGSDSGIRDRRSSGSGTRERRSSDSGTRERRGSDGGLHRRFLAAVGKSHSFDSRTYQGISVYGRHGVAVPGKKVISSSLVDLTSHPKPEPEWYKLDLDSDFSPPQSKTDFSRKEERQASRPHSLSRSQSSAKPHTASIKYQPITLSWTSNPSPKTTPIPQQTTPTSKQATPMSQQATPTSQQAASRWTKSTSQQAKPTSRQATPTFQQTAPISHQATPTSQQATSWWAKSTFQQTTPMPQQTTPMPQQTTPMPQQATPTLQQATPGSQEATSWRFTSKFQRAMPTFQLTTPMPISLQATPTSQAATSRRATSTFQQATPQWDAQQATPTSQYFCKKAPQLTMPILKKSPPMYQQTTPSPDASQQCAKPIPMKRSDTYQQTTPSPDASQQCIPMKRSDTYQQTTPSPGASQQCAMKRSDTYQQTTPSPDASQQCAKPIPMKRSDSGSSLVFNYFNPDSICLVKQPQPVCPQDRPAVLPLKPLSNQSPVFHPDCPPDAPPGHQRPPTPQLGTPWSTPPLFHGVPLENPDDLDHDFFPSRHYEPHTTCYQASYRPHPSSLEYQPCCQSHRESSGRVVIPHTALSPIPGSPCTPSPLPGPFSELFPQILTVPQYSPASPSSPQLLPSNEGGYTGDPGRPVSEMKLPSQLMSESSCVPPSPPAITAGGSVQATPISPYAVSVISNPDPVPPASTGPTPSPTSPWQGATSGASPTPLSHGYDHLEKKKAEPRKSASKSAKAQTSQVPAKAQTSRVPAEPVAGAALQRKHTHQATPIPAPSQHFLFPPNGSKGHKKGGKASSPDSQSTKGQKNVDAPPRVGTAGVRGKVGSSQNSKGTDVSVSPNFQSGKGRKNVGVSPDPAEKVGVSPKVVSAEGPTKKRDSPSAGPKRTGVSPATGMSTPGGMSSLHGHSDYPSPGFAHDEALPRHQSLLSLAEPEGAQLSVGADYLCSSQSDIVLSGRRGGGAHCPLGDYTIGGRELSLCSISDQTASDQATIGSWSDHLTVGSFEETWLFLMSFAGTAITPGFLNIVGDCTPRGKVIIPPPRTK